MNETRCKTVEKEIREFRKRNCSNNKHFKNK